MIACATLRAEICEKCDGCRREEERDGGCSPLECKCNGGGPSSTFETFLDLSIFFLIWVLGCFHFFKRFKYVVGFFSLKIYLGCVTCTLTNTSFLRFEALLTL